ncbi:MAG: hypothetical protein AABY22_16535 [Nanoarchaeota archaeon]
MNKINSKIKFMVFTIIVVAILVIGVYAADIIAKVGDFNVDSGTFFVDSSGDKVGIGTSSPTHKLNVIGSTNLSGDLFAGNSTLFVNTTGVSIGTTTPKSRLTVYEKFSSVSGLNIINLNSTVKVDSVPLGTGTNLTGILANADSEDDDASNVYGVYSLASDGTNTYGIYASASGGVVNYAGYFASADVYVEKNVSAQGFIDRSNWCNMTGSAAIGNLSLISGTSNNQINKSTMPSCALKTLVVGVNQNTNETITEQGRDIGAYISFLTIVNKEQQQQINLLVSELCARDPTYSFC